MSGKKSLERRDGSPEKGTLQREQSKEKLDLQLEHEKKRLKVKTKSALGMEGLKGEVERGLDGLFSNFDGLDDTLKGFVENLQDTFYEFLDSLGIKLGDEKKAVEKASRYVEQADFVQRGPIALDDLPKMRSWTLGLPSGTPITSDIQHNRKISTKPMQNHNGVDLGTAVGTPLHSPGVGRVKFVGGGPSSTAGYYTEVQYNVGGSLKTIRFMHLKGKPALKAGDKVEAGDLLGHTGASGAGITGPHLHFEVRSENNGVEDPFLYLPASAKSQLSGMREGKEDGFWCHHDHEHGHA